jgi:hypothetical protein
MRKKYWETTEFKSLSKKWEKKIEESGLVDVEVSIGDSRELKQNSSNVFRQMDQVRREAKENYFKRLSECIQTADFDCYIDMVVMHQKAQGAKIIEICVELAKQGHSRYRRTVRLIVRKYEDRWGIRHWTPDQLKYNWPKRQRTR